MLLRKHQRKRAVASDYSVRRGPIAWGWQRSVWTGLMLRWYTRFAPAEAPYFEPADRWEGVRVLKRRDKEEGGTGKAPRADQGEWAEMYPFLAEFLACPSFADGKPRHLGVLTIEVKGIVWQATLKDVHHDEWLRIEVPRPEDTLKALDEVLNAPSQPWLADPYPRKRKPKLKP